jgi:hypothetical protein
VAQTNQAVTKAKKLYLTFKEGEEMDVLFTSANQAPNKEFPEGAWLVMKSDGHGNDVFLAVAMGTLTILHCFQWVTLMQNTCSQTQSMLQSEKHTV